MSSPLLAALALLGRPEQDPRGNSPQVSIRDAELAATDGLGRSLPGYAQTGPSKPNRWVGLFYWQWHGDDRWGKDYDMTEFLKTHPYFKDFSASPPGGPNNPTWYWAQPLFGYYRSTDPWVVRKHLVMLAHAGVDFLFLDYTNAQVYDPELQTLLNVARELKSKGVAVPRLAFFLNHEPEWKAESLYAKWYRPGRYDDLWFRWAGKPLIMSPYPVEGEKLKDPSLLPAIQKAFTWRPTWAFHDPTKEPTKWRFMDVLQTDGKPRPALGPDGKPEQIVVSKSTGGPIWDNMKLGGVSTYPGHAPEYDAQWLSGEQAKGLYFGRSWEAALANPAPMLLVTGWNEWRASVWETPGVVMLGRTTAKGQGHIVDQFNMDFNRDLEPMRGGYEDAYYWQFLANVRRYKGMAPPQKPSAPRTIRLDGPLSQWDGVRPVYVDADGDVARRDWPGSTPGSHYRDDSARNDVVRSQVASDARNVAFRVTTSARLTTPIGRSWMILFVDADANPKTGWHGYDLLIGRDRDGGSLSVERNVGGAWNWRKEGSARFRRSERDLVLVVPRATLGKTFGFKWADNLPEQPSVMDFYTKGDVAPDSRFNARYAFP